jgi:spoIIIJ-associated protein
MIDKSELEKIEQLTGEMLDNLEFDFDTINAEVIESTNNDSDEISEMIKIDIIGANLSSLIGRFGKTMFAFQHVLNMAYNAGKSDAERKGIIIDVNGYREKREKELRSYADRALTEVRQTNLPMALPPMKPAERRIIHMALKEEEGIVTTSEGDEPNRYVVIKPS